MPFTFSHPSIILPFAYSPRNWFSMTGLIIGSLTPDFEYFLRMRMQGSFGHSLLGLFFFDLPVGLLLAFVFHLIIKNDLLLNLPFFLKAKLLKFNNFRWIDYFKLNWFTVVYSILIGGFSHLFWDGFTHHDGFFVDLIPNLKTKVELFHFQIPIFTILQHTSSLIGAILILIALFKLPTDKLIEKHIDLIYWFSLFSIALLVLVIRIFNELKIDQLGNVIVSIISSFVIGLIFAPKISSEINLFYLKKMKK